eukprot:m.79266 g.79266  ORF g.79266 m.79266 type:complete len:277 (-) comp8178_c0_seq1:173-1003(-)
MSSSTGCSLPSCGAPSARARCARCKEAVYCNAECQRAHWPEHRKPCKAAARAAATAALPSVDAASAGKHLVIGEYHLNQGDHESALASLQTAHDLAHGDGSAGGLSAAIAGSFGNVYEAMGRHSDALTHFTKARELSESHGVAAVRAMALAGEGRAYLAMGQHASARAAFETQATLARAARDTAAHLQAARSLVDVLEAQKAAGDGPKAEIEAQMRKAVEEVAALQTRLDKEQRRAAADAADEAGKQPASQEEQCAALQEDGIAAIDQALANMGTK